MATILPTDPSGLSLLNLFAQNQLGADFSDKYVIGSPFAINNPNENTAVFANAKVGSGYFGSYRINYNRIDLSTLDELPIFDSTGKTDVTSMLSDIVDHFGIPLVAGDYVNRTLVPTDLDFTISAGAQSHVYTGALHVKLAPALGTAVIGGSKESTILHILADETYRQTIGTVDYLHSPNKDRIGSPHYVAQYPFTKHISQDGGLYLLGSFLLKFPSHVLARATQFWNLLHFEVSVPIAFNTQSPVQGLQMQNDYTLAMVGVIDPTVSTEAKTTCLFSSSASVYAGVTDEIGAGNLEWIGLHQLNGVVSFCVFGGAQDSLVVDITSFLTSDAFSIVYQQKQDNSYLLAINGELVADGYFSVAPVSILCNRLGPLDTATNTSSLTLGAAGFNISELILDISVAANRVQSLSAVMADNWII